jgi:uncharacterized protein
MIQLHIKRIFLLSTLMAAVVVTSSCRHKAQNLACAKQACYEIELASTAAEMALGLMHRTHLEADRGMLFIFSESTIHPFWMKNTLIPLDMIWMDHARRVVHIEEVVPPCTADPCPRYTPSHESLYVLELNAGEVKRIDLQVGDQLEFKLQR